MSLDQSLHVAMHEAMHAEAARRQVVEQLEDVQLSRNAYRLACVAYDEENARLRGVIVSQRQTIRELQAALVGRTRSPR